MKIDGRTLTRETLEAMRFMALDRMAEGESPAAVSASFGMHRAWAYKVRLKARGRGKGKRALRLRRAPGRQRTLIAAQERQVFRWINGKNPRQYGFDFGLWTHQIVGELITQRFDVTLSLASVGALLARVGLTPQKPLQRAYQRDPEAIARWQRETPQSLARPGTTGRISTSGMNPGFARTRCTARPGARRATRPWSTYRANAKASAPRRRSVPRGRFGSLPTKVG